MPVHDLAPSSVIQRKVALYGPRIRQTPEDMLEREMRKELRAVVPELWGGMTFHSTEKYVFDL